MKAIFIILLSIFTMSAMAQKIGINKINPQEALDVKGHINVDSTLKVKGNEGKPGDVLMKNAANTMQWGPLSMLEASCFTNMVLWTRAYKNWLIPAGVTRIYVEAWGGGGGGDGYAGGGGAGYVAAIFQVDPLTILDFNIGQGGTGNGSDGGDTDISYGTAKIYAYGGKSAKTTGGTAMIQGSRGGGFSHSASFFNYYGIKGEDGNVRSKHFEPASSTVNIFIIKGGAGGNSPYHPYSGGQGGYLEQREGSPVIDVSKNSETGSYPGGGGGGGTVSVYPGAIGGDGLVRIHW